MSEPQTSTSIPHPPVDVVRALLGEPSAVVGSWDAVALQGGFGTLAGQSGVHLLSGQARVGADERTWRVVLKTLAPVADQDDPTNIRYWRREPLLYGSGLLDDLPPGPARAALLRPRRAGRRERLALARARPGGRRARLAAGALGAGGAAPRPAQRRLPGRGGEPALAAPARALARRPAAADLARAPHRAGAADRGRGRRPGAAPLVAAAGRRRDPAPLGGAGRDLRRARAAAADLRPRRRDPAEPARPPGRRRGRGDGRDRLGVRRLLRGRRGGRADPVGRGRVLPARAGRPAGARRGALRRATWTGCARRAGAATGEPVRLAYCAHAALRNGFNAVGAIRPDPARRAAIRQSQGRDWEELAERRAAMRPFLLERADEARALIAAL